MKWTKTLPIEAGYYWFLEDESEITIVEVIEEDPDGFITWAVGDDNPVYLRDMEGFWFGPIHIPTLPE